MLTFNRMQFSNFKTNIFFKKKNQNLVAEWYIGFEQYYTHCDIRFGS